MTFVGFSQSNSYYKVGDTLYYDNNRATYGKTNTLVIVKETNVDKNSSVYKVAKFLLDNAKEEYILDSEFTTNGLQLLKADGNFVSYHKNGNKASEGKTVNGKKDTGIWSYFYESGEKRSEEKMSSETYFSDQIQNLVINFWDEKGNQSVTNGNGFAQFTDDENHLVKGTYKGGLKNGLWTAFSGKQKKYEETYKKGKLSKGTSWNDKGESYEYEEVNTPAYYKKNDRNTVRKYVAKKFNSNTAGVSGDIYVTFLVTKEGLLRNINIIRGLTEAYNAEVERVLTEMKAWVPAKKRGEAYNSTYSLNLRFTE
ncbi:TonB family protein [Polaribacter sp. Hel1_85]|nr:TonB family protein [Polaribacter sp. Hel1_85]